MENLIRSWVHKHHYGQLSEYHREMKSYIKQLDKNKKTKVRTPLGIGPKDFESTNEFDRLAATALRIFETCDRYTHQEVLGWMVFSAMLWDGIKDEEILTAFLFNIAHWHTKLYPDAYNAKPNLDAESSEDEEEIIVTSPVLRPFIHHTTITTVDYSSSRGIGYRALEDNLVRSVQQIVIGNMTRMWIVRLAKISEAIQFPKDPKDCLGVIAKYVGYKAERINSLYRLMRQEGLFFQQTREIHPLPIAMSCLSTGARIQMVGLRENNWLNIVSLTKKPEFISKMPDQWKNAEPPMVFREKIPTCDHSDAKQIRRAFAERAREIQKERQQPEPPNPGAITNLAPADTENAELLPPDLEAVSELLEKNVLSPLGQVLTHWYMSMRDVVTSTRQQYFGQACHILMIADNSSDCTDWDKDDFIALYRRLARFSMDPNRGLDAEDDDDDDDDDDDESTQDTKKDDSKGAMYSALQRWHSFLVDHYADNNEAAVPKINIHQYLRVIKSTIVNSNALSPYVYQSLLTACNKALSFDANILKLFIILAYRTGMRRSELLGITIEHFTGLDTDKPYLTKNTRGKTTSAQRRIPLWGLLLPSELNFLKTVLKTISPFDKKPLFARVSFSEDRYPETTLIHTISELLRGILPRYQRINFHMFRHAALSNFMLASGGHPELVESLTDYTAEDVERMQLSFRGAHINKQENFIVGAREAGHLTPEVTFLHYFAYGWLNLTYTLARCQDLIPMRAVYNITQWPENRLRKFTNNNDHSMICLNDISLFLYMDLHDRARTSFETTANRKTGHEPLDPTLDLPPMFRNFKIEYFLNWLYLMDEESDISNQVDEIEKIVNQNPNPKTGRKQKKIDKEKTKLAGLETELQQIRGNISTQARKIHRDSGKSYGALSPYENATAKDKSPFERNHTEMKRRFHRLKYPLPPLGKTRVNIHLFNPRKKLCDTVPLKMGPITSSILDTVISNIRQLRMESPRDYGFLVNRLIKLVRWDNNEIRSTGQNIDELLHLIEILCRIFPNPDDIVRMNNGDYTCEILFIRRTKLSRKKGLTGTVISNASNTELSKKRNKRRVKHGADENHAIVYLREHYPNFSSIRKNTADEYRIQLLVNGENRYDILFYIPLIIFMTDITIPADGILN
ncbi:site-specific integrase [Cardiobacteriaceae bacterium TAE3-ERU3]|nr:site-specific integrase [Cardiobacteriaceae bacterium TAE3-ERU3]